MNENDEKNKRRLYFIRIKKTLKQNKTKEFRKNFGCACILCLSVCVCGIMNIWNFFLFSFSSNNCEKNDDDTRWWNIHLPILFWRLIIIIIWLCVRWCVEQNHHHHLYPICSLSKIILSSSTWCYTCSQYRHSFFLSWIHTPSFIHSIHLFLKRKKKDTHRSNNKWMKRLNNFLFFFFENNNKHIHTHLKPKRTKHPFVAASI